MGARSAGWHRRAPLCTKGALALLIAASACRSGDVTTVGPDGGIVKVGKAKATERGDKKPIDPAKYAAYMTRYPFGGRTSEWWSARLTELQSGPTADPAVFALTVERAQANGLLVDVTTMPITVKPGPELTARLLERMELE